MRTLSCMIRLSILMFMFVDAKEAVAQPPLLHTWIKQAANRHGVESALLLAIVMVESNGNPHAVSPANARGLGQLLLSTAREYDPLVGLEDLFNPVLNLDLAARHIAMLHVRINIRFPGLLPIERVGLIAAAYNAGLGRVLESQGVPPIQETLKHNRKVLKLYENYRKSSRAEI